MMDRKTMFRTLFAVVLCACVFAAAPLRAQENHHPDTTATGVHGSDAAHGTETAGGSEEGHGGGHDLKHLTPSQEMLEILDHKVVNSPYIHEFPFPGITFPQDWIVTIGEVKLNFSLNRHIFYMLFAALIITVLLTLAARQNKRNFVPKGWGSMIESVVLFVRDEIAQPFLGHNAQRYLPILLTFFFFILTMNLIGLFPFGATPTGNINITAGLALISLSFMIFGGMKANGAFGYIKGLVPHGLPWPIYIILFPLEVLGLFTKPFALAVRLFANMVSGSLLIGAFYALIFGLDTVLISPVSLAFLIFMTMLKTFVCLIQAYVFTVLSAFFIGMSLHQEH